MPRRHIWRSCGHGGPRRQRCKRDGLGFGQETTMNELAGTTIEVVRRKKRQLIPLKSDSTFKLFPKVRNATKFSGKTVRRDLFCLEVGENQTPQSKRKDPPPQKSDSTTGENFLFQIPAFQRMTNQDHCSKSIAAFLGVTLLA